MRLSSLALVTVLANQVVPIVVEEPDPILDQLTATSEGAYSLRLLTADYVGDAIRVRRSSDDTEQDIGFVDGELDTDDLETFVGANSAYITTWYDQSGNGNDAVMATAANQPRIVNAGTIETLTNGKPAIRFIRSSSTRVAASFSLAQPYSESTVARRNNAIGGNTEVISGGAGYRGALACIATTGYFQIQAGFDLDTTTVVPTTTFNATTIYNGENSKLYFNGDEIVSGHAGTDGMTGPYEIGSWASGDNAADVLVSEKILFSGALSAEDRGLLEDSQDFFMI